MQNQDWSIQKAMQFAKTAEGQQLLRMLQQTGGINLEEAMKKAAEGDFSQAQKVFSGLMQNPEARKLLENLGR